MPAERSRPPRRQAAIHASTTIASYEDQELSSPEYEDQELSSQEAQGQELPSQEYEDQEPPRPKVNRPKRYIAPFVRRHDLSFVQ